MRTLPLLALLACAPGPELDTLPLAETLATQGLAAWECHRLPLDWIPTVWVYGLHELREATGEPSWSDCKLAWLDRRLEPFTDDPPRRMDSSDSLSPAILASLALGDDPQAPWEPIVEAAHAWLEEAPRTAEGAIVHWGDEVPFGVPRQVWIDSLFMFGVFLLVEYDRTGDRAHLELFVEQYLLFAEHCRDEATGLYRHAYDDPTGENIPEEPVFWARGNSWVLIAAAELLVRLEPDDPLAEAIRPLFLEHAAALMAHQAEDGLWHTVIDAPHDPANYTETAGAALIAHALARGHDLIGEEALAAVGDAVRGIEGRTFDRGDGHLVLQGTSYGTIPGDHDYYVGVPVADDLMLGVGAAVMLLARAHGLPDRGR